MQPKPLYFRTFVALALVIPAPADVIYSNLQNLDIPANFDGLYLDVNLPYASGKSNTSMTSPVAGWDINPYYGGKVVANSPGFQPVRGGTGSSSPIVNLTVDSLVSASSVFSTFTQGIGGETPGAPGYGTSQMLTTSGGSFTAGTEGYLGFKLYTGANYTAPNYGWMRVVLTNDTGGAVIKDWAYETGGGAIATGNVLQSGSTVTLNSALGSFTLGSQIAGSNSLVKDGAGTAMLTGANSYSGVTTIKAGTLKLDGVGGIANSATIVVGDTGSSGAVLDVTTKSGGFTVGSTQTLMGIGSISGAVIVDGILAPGASIESLASGALTFNNGSTFDYELDSSAVASVAADFQKVLGDLTLSGTVTLGLTDLAALPSAFADGTSLSLIQYAGTWNGGFFTYEGNLLSNNEVFGAGLNSWKITYNADTGGENFFSEYNELGGQFVTLTAVPEPGPWLALGCLLGSGAFLRRRQLR